MGDLGQAQPVSIERDNLLETVGLARHAHLEVGQIGQLTTHKHPRFDAEARLVLDLA